MLEPRECSVCGSEFKPYKDAHYTCSPECSRRRQNGKRAVAPAAEPDRGRLRALDRLLKAKGIDLDDLADAQIDAVKFYEQGYKDAEGVGQVQQLAAITISPAWESGPEWPVVQRAPERTALPKAKLRKRGGWKTSVVWPDLQVGYFRGPDGLEPTHDERAIAIALEITRDVNPDKVIIGGDALDLPEFGKYRLSPAFRDTTQASVDRMERLLREVGEASPSAERDWLEGNHELRLTNSTIDNAVAAFRLRQGNAPESWPVLSIPSLCQTDQNGWTYHPGYPAATYWLTDKLKLTHGNHVRSGGSTAHAYLKDEKVSVVYFHIHRREWAEVTRQDHDGPRTVMAASPGCLCRVDGRVPSTKGGLDLDGRPITAAENWQQGLAVIEYNETTGEFNYEQVPILFDKWARWRGKEYAA